MVSGESLEALTVFPQNFHNRKLGEITGSYTVRHSSLSIPPEASENTMLSGETERDQ